MSFSALPALNAEALLEALTAGALITTADGDIRYANPAFCALSGVAPSDLTGKRLADLLTLPPDATCTLCEGTGAESADLSEQSPEQPIAHVAFLIPLPSRRDASDLQPLDLQPDGTPRPGQRVRIKHGTVSPDTRLCLVEPFWEESALARAHNEFVSTVSTVSHEFRTPLTSIKGFADTMIRYGDQLPEAEKQRFITIIKDQADRLIRLVENLLAVSRAGTDTMDLNYRPIPLQRLLDKVIQGLQAKAVLKSGRERRFNVRLNPTALTVWGDTDRLEQVLINLVDNAVKYSPANSTVHVHAGFLPDDDTRIRIVIRDEGAGIPADLLPRVFTKFYRVDSPLEQDVEGTGLGLYIAQSLTQAMGGRILAESTPGQGSAFTLILPAATPERQAMHQRRMAVDDA
jgi:two-component system phosphate regulon sensor histidine kinase PhoR